MNVWTDDDFEIIENATNGRRAVVLPSGAVIELGDTGLRDVTGLMNMQWLDAGRIVFERVGWEVHFWLIGLLIKAGAPSSITVLTNNRTGMSPVNPPYIDGGVVFPGTGNVTALAGPPAFASVNTSHGIALHGVQPGLTYNGHIPWKTRNAWWSGALPGVGDGQPVGV